MEFVYVLFSDEDEWEDIVIIVSKEEAIMHQSNIQINE